MKRYGGLAIVLTLSAVACASMAQASDRAPGIPGGQTAVQSPAGGDLNVMRVRAFIKDGRPQAFVEGELVDGCSALDSVSQRRRGNEVDITLRFRRQGEVCTMILQFVNHWVPLDGSFAPGDYIVRANTQRVQFRLVAGARGLRIDPDPGPLPQPPYFPQELSPAAPDPSAPDSGRR
jgi:hypothetical protein